MSRTPISKVVVLALILLVGAAIWWHQEKEAPQIPVHLQKVRCIPERSNCNATIDGGQLQWRIDAPIQYLKAFPNRIYLKNIADKDVRQISIDYVMIGMEMAANRSVFKRISSGVWQTESVIPICSSGRKDWVAVVRLQTRQGIWQTGFMFSVTKK